MVLTVGRWHYSSQKASHNATHVCCHKRAYTSDQLENLHFGNVFKKTRLYVYPTPDRQHWFIINKSFTAFKISSRR